jgi:hypothetical protein
MMNEKDKDKFEGVEGMSVDVEGLGVDWSAQRARINRGIEARRVRVSPFRNAFAGLAAATVVALLAMLIWWRMPAIDQAQNMDQFFAEVDAISDNYVPAGLYVLNGFIDERPDAEAMVEFVLPTEGEEEDLWNTNGS